MNKTYYVLGALVAVLLIGYVVTSSKNDEQVSGTPVNSEMTPLAGTGDYVIDSEKSVLNWQGRKPLLNNYYDKGTVKVSAGSATLTDGLITAGEFTIDMNTITALSTGKNAGMDFLTKHLKSPDFFDVEKYPTAQLKLTSVEKAEGENTFKVKGDLTVKDKTNPIEFTSLIFSESEALKAKATLELDRTLWNIQYGSGKFFQNLGDKIIDDMFKIELDLTANKK